MTKNCEGRGKPEVWPASSGAPILQGHWLMPGFVQGFLRRMRKSVADLILSQPTIWAGLDEQGRTLTWKNYPILLTDIVCLYLSIVAGMPLTATDCSNFPVWSMNRVVFIATSITQLDNFWTSLQWLLMWRWLARIKRTAGEVHLNSSYPQPNGGTARGCHLNSALKSTDLGGQSDLGQVKNPSFATHLTQ